MYTKTSIPNVRVIKRKDGLRNENVVIHPDANKDIQILKYHIDEAIDIHGKNMPLTQIVGLLEFIKTELIG